MGRWYIGLALSLTASGCMIAATGFFPDHLPPDSGSPAGNVASTSASTNGTTGTVSPSTNANAAGSTAVVETPQALIIGTWVTTNQPTVVTAQFRTDNTVLAAVNGVNQLGTYAVTATTATLNFPGESPVTYNLSFSANGSTMTMGAAIYARR